ncbi:hypothetical protein KBY23_11005 [Ruegeria pomeroyi]|nr:hypothetical protein [Ruegeria pomeroyi]
MTKQSKSKTNTNTLRAELKRLHALRIVWQDDVYKRSNEALYEILEGCHALLEQLRKNVDLRKKLNDALKKSGFTVRSNTSIELKVVRAVFGVENNRTHAYVRVLQVAKAELPDDWTLTEWIEERGGVEEVRRTPKEGPTIAQKNEEYRKNAEKVLFDTDPIVPRFKAKADIRPADDGDYEFAVALVRVDGDGKAAIVFGSNKNALVQAVLTEAGKKIAKDKEKADVTSKQTKKRKKRDAVLDADDSDFDLPKAA